ncbi:MAG: AAA family ATPase [Gaiellaceae bacterium]
MITDVNPFVYSHPVAPDDVIDRDGETRELLAAAVGGHYVRLYGPRKYGKTSLLRRALLEGEREEGLTPVLVDLYGVLSVADVAIRFERAYAKQLKGKTRARIEEFLQSTGLGLSLGALGISARLQLEPRADPLPALHALLDLPLRLEAGGGFRALIVLDEFQDIAKVRELDALIRSHIQFQGEVASFVFAGSEPGLMRELFEDGERPLYGQAVPMRLGRLADADIAGYIIGRFRETERSVGEALNPLLDAAKGHPQRAMLLAHRLWAAVERGGTATLADWATAHAAALAELQPEFDAHWRRLSTNAQKALRAVVVGNGSPFQRRVLEQLDLHKSTARAALQALVANATIEQDAETYALIDPLFAEWIAALGEQAGV